MKPYQQRVVDEKTDLDAKVARLKTFLEGSTFKSLPGEECARLTRQLGIMENYSGVLGERIAAFTDTPTAKTPDTCPGAAGASLHHAAIVMPDNVGVPAHAVGLAMIAPRSLVAEFSRHGEAGNAADDVAIIGMDEGRDKFPAISLGSRSSNFKLDDADELVGLDWMRLVGVAKLLVDDRRCADADELRIEAVDLVQERVQILFNDVVIHTPKLHAHTHFVNINI